MSMAQSASRNSNNDSAIASTGNSTTSRTIQTAISGGSEPDSNGLPIVEETTRRLSSIAVERQGTGIEFRDNDSVQYYEVTGNGYNSDDELLEEEDPDEEEEYDILMDEDDFEDDDSSDHPGSLGGGSHNQSTTMTSRKSRDLSVGRSRANSKGDQYSSGSGGKIDSVQTQNSQGRQVFSGLSTTALRSTSSKRERRSIPSSYGFSPKSRSQQRLSVRSQLLASQDRMKQMASHNQHQFRQHTQLAHRMKYGQPGNLTSGSSAASSTNSSPHGSRSPALGKSTVGHLSSRSTASTMAKRASQRTASPLSGSSLRSSPSSHFNTRMTSLPGPLPLSRTNSRVDRPLPVMTNLDFVVHVPFADRWFWKDNVHFGWSKSGRAFIWGVENVDQLATKFGIVCRTLSNYPGAKYWTLEAVTSFNMS